MGNSGSMNGLSGYDEGYHYHHQHQHHQYHQQQHQQQRYHDGAGTCSWMDSYKRDPPRGRSARDGGYQPDELQSGEGHWNTQLSSQHQQQQQQQQQQQFKVLPDVPGKVARLRSTNNGNILHAGGTISKSKQQLQRSKSISSPTYQQHQQRADEPGGAQLDVSLSSLPPVPSRMLLLTRSRTQLSMLDDGEQTTMRHLVSQSRTAAAATATAAAANKQQDYNHWKRFGSEPDLRVPKGQGNQGDRGSAGGAPGAGDTRTNTSVTQSKIMKGKGKKKAPVPPAPVEKRKSGKEAIGSQRIIAYSPLRKTNSDTSSALPPAIVGEGGGAGATSSSSRLRLFKTRAEAKKTPAAAKLPEASDAKFATKAVTGAAGGPKAAAAATVESVTLVEGPPHPRSFFRREKTFDIGLLTLEARKRQIQPTGATAGCGATARPTLSPPLTHRKSIVKTLLEQDGHTRHAGHRSPGVVESGKGKVAGGGARSHGTKGAKQQGEKSLAAAAQYLKAPKATNTLVIPVEPPLERERDVSTSVTPSPPPPPAAPPKASMYFGMGTVPNEAGPEAGPGSKQQPRQRQKSDAPVLSTSSYSYDDARTHDEGGENEPEGEEVEPRVVGSMYQQHDQHHSIESLADSDPDDESRQKNRHDPTEAAEHARHEEEEGAVVVASIDEIDRTQMDIIDRFAASLLHESRRFHSTDSMASSEADLRTLSVLSPHDCDPEGQEIALCLRPTLPRKQFDIPRFSPAAAWRLLTTDDEFGRDTNGGGGAGGAGEGGVGEDAADSDEAGPVGKGAGRDHGPFLCGGDLHALDAASEDRIERVYREPVPGLQDNKSGDSGISGDAGLLDIGRDEPKGTLGGVNEEHHRCHGGWLSNGLRPTAWTPQQDLEDDDDTTTGSSTGGDGYRHQQHHPHHHPLPQHQQQQEQQENDARHGLGAENEFASKGHLFSLSLPRENHLSIYTGGSIDDKVEKHVFNSLQKLHKSVSDAFKSDDDVGGAIDSNNNWFLGRLTTKPGSVPPAHAHEKRQLAHPSGLTPLAGDSGLRLRSFSPENLTATATMLHGPISDVSRGKITSSISYLVSGRHMMYLPKEPTRLLIQPGADRLAKHNHNNNSRIAADTQRAGVCPPNLPSYHHQQQQQAKLSSAKVSGQPVGDRHGGRGCKVSPSGGPGAPGDEDSRKQREDKENLQDPVPVAAAAAATKLLLEPSFPVKLSNRRNHRFTFQSTIRQIEKRRVAEKLSREAEIKEAMRLSELEAMQRVEEEFQKKRAREKASIRHQLRLFSMEDQQDTDYGVDQHHQPEEVGMLEVTQQLENKRLEADLDSLPHQTGLYRKREFSPIERQLQCYKRPNGGGGTEGTMYPFLRQQDDQDDQHQDQQLGTLQRQQHQQQQVLNGDYRENGFVGEDNDNGDSGSSLGYVDTRTPYISRIIQAKSSKSFALRK
ncbi:uncharacterized protein LOC128267164 [Anopheles cruzii]|uniref:uncharacterized protein LOC128267164 n=1 Tax=Anopheles cruzii TaxID=68878 RepID=UPI0022EC5FCA|nr:uncharacterized protein LOC128267164 [Anopheles cruzii]